MDELSIEKKLKNETNIPFELTLDDLRCLLLLIHMDVTNNVLQVEIENNVSESFRNHLDGLMYWLIRNEKTNTKEIAQVYEKLSREYLKRIIKL